MALAATASTSNVTKISVCTMSFPSIPARPAHSGRRVAGVRDEWRRTGPADRLEATCSLGADVDAFHGSAWDDVVEGALVARE